MDRIFNAEVQRVSRRRRKEIIISILTFLEFLSSI
jgi:hypothetical protein